MAEEMFRPPINRGMKVLDRTFFQKRMPLSAARIFDKKNITRCRKELERSRDILSLERCAVIKPDPTDTQGECKCILLRSQITDDGQPRPWSKTVQRLTRENLISIVPYELHLDYDYWTYHDIATSILPPTSSEDEEIPSGFTTVGHVAHLNLRDKYLPYKETIGNLLLDKNHSVRTVINKIDDVGDENEYRTFKYEVLAGPDDMDVEIRELDCTFRFNYAKVYWNSRLNTEHERLVKMFREGEAVCDVMAGIGPFAVPAGRKKVFVWANDLNPDSCESLVDAIDRNKVGDFVKPSCEDGRTFIKTATAELLRSDHTVEVTKKLSRSETKKERVALKGRAAPEVIQTLNRPRTFSHYVMNLPATAIQFLPSFIGLYNENDRKLLPPDFQLPMVHVYCFSTKSEDNVAEGIKICEEISRQLDYHLTPQSPEVTIYDVRDVAPKKRMFCASFRLPEEVAFRQSS